MVRLQSDLKFGALSAAAAAADTALSSPEFAALPVVASPDILAVTLDPGGSTGAPEIVHVTAHTAGATTVTVVRGQEGTAARALDTGVRWAHSMTTEDFATKVDTADVTETNSGSRIVRRDSAGDIHARLLRSQYTVATATPNYLMAQHAVGTGDNYARPSTLAQVKAAMGAADVARLIATGDGLTGGGNLTADRTLVVDRNTVPIINTSTTADVNTLVQPGFYAVNNAVNMPTADTWHHVVVSRHTTGYVLQFATPLFSDSLWYRRNHNGTWQPWVRVTDEAMLAARSITAGDGLTGGGALSASRTLAVDSTVARKNINNSFSVQQVIEKAAHASGADDYHAELRAPLGATPGEISLRFHQASRWWNQIRSRGGSFRFTGGNSDSLIPIYVADGAEAATAATKGYVDSHIGDVSHVLQHSQAQSDPASAYPMGMSYQRPPDVGGDWTIAAQVLITYRTDTNTAVQYGFHEEDGIHTREWGGALGWMPWVQVAIKGIGTDRMYRQDTEPVSPQEGDIWVTPDGAQELSLRPYYEAYSSAQQIIVHAAWADVALHTVASVRGVTRANNSTVTIPHDGLWAFTGVVGFNTNSTGRRIARIYITTVSDVSAEIARMEAVPTHGYATISLAGARWLTAGTIVALSAYQSSGADLAIGGNLNGRTQMAMYPVAA